jgi:hypothetical protein
LPGAVVSSVVGATLGTAFVGEIFVTASMRVGSSRHAASAATEAATCTVGPVSVALRSRRARATDDAGTDAGFRGRGVQIFVGRSSVSF